MSWEEIRSFFASLTLEKLLPVVLILVIGTIAVKLLLKLFDRALSRSKLDRTIFTFLKAIMRVLLYAIVILIAAGSLGVDVTSLVALLSVVSLAISLAVQNALSNVVGSITLLATHPFRVGDFVQIGSDSGTVEQIGMSYTQIRTADGKRIYIPNSDASAARIYNYTVEGKRRIDLTFSASYDDDMDRVKAAILAAAQHPKLCADTPPEVHISEYADSSVNYLLLLWVAPADFFEVKFAVTEAVKKKFDEEGISIPYPQLDVHMPK